MSATRAIVVALALALATAAGACGDSGDGGAAAAGDEAGSGASNGKRVGIALGGPKNDRGFYQSAYEGLKTAEEREGLKTSVVDSLEDPQGRLDAMRNLSADNDLVIGGGAEFIEAAKTLAPQFPDVEYVVLTGIADGSQANVHAYVPRQGVPAYIAGAVGATISATKHIGFVGGAEIPPTDASDKAYKQGFEDTLAEGEYSRSVIGTFNDPAKAKEAAKAQIAQGADALFAFLDAGTPGVVQAIEESGTDVNVFAAIAPRCEESERFVGTTVLNVARVVELLIGDWKAGKLPDGTRFYGVETPEVQRFELCPAWRKPKLEKVVETLTSKLNDDAITLPEGV